jgi:hypothetical protein
MWRRFVCTETGVFFVLWFALLGAGRSAMLQDPGTFWHVVTGGRILDSHAVPRSDPFSFTRAGQPWVADQWLPECAMAAAYRAAGWDGLLLTTATLLATIYTWLASRLLRSGLHVMPVLLLLAVAILAGSPQFHVRPLVITLGLQGIVFAWLVDIEAGRRSLRQIGWLIPLFVVWANCHGGVLAGIGTAGLCVGGWIALWLCGMASPVQNRRDAAAMLLFLAAAALATLVNPYGIDLPREWLATLSMPLQGVISEHSPLDFTDASGIVAIAILGAYLAVLLTTLPRGPRATWIVPLVWFVLAIQRVRNVSLLGITTLVAMGDMLPHSRIAGWLAKHDMFRASPQVPPARQEGNNGRTSSFLPLVLPAIVVLATFFVQAAGIEIPLLGRGWAKFDSARWPVELLPQLTEIDRSGPEGGRIFNDLLFGGFLIHHTPHLRIFIDDRCSVYGGAFLKAYDDARRGEPADLETWWQRDRFPYALVETGGEFDHYLSGSGHWTILGRTPVATLYQRDLGTAVERRYTVNGQE